LIQQIPLFLSEQSFDPVDVIVKLVFKFLRSAFLVFKVKVFFAKSRIPILQVVCESLYFHQEHNKLISALLLRGNAKRMHNEYAPYQRPSCIHLFLKVMLSAHAVF